MNTEKRSEATEITRKNLKDAFWSIYGRKKIERISVREIVHTAGYNRGTFYNYYHDIFDLLEDDENDLLDTADLCFSLVLGNDDMRVQTETCFKNFFENKERLRILFGINGDAFFAEKLKKRIKSTLRRFIQKTPSSEYSTEYKLEFYSSGLIGIIQMWLDSDSDLPLSVFSDVIIDSIRL